MPNDLELGSILEEIKKHETDPQVITFLAEYLDAEKDYGYLFKEPIRDLLTQHVARKEA